MAKGPKTERGHIKLDLLITHQTNATDIFFILLWKHYSSLHIFIRPWDTGWLPCSFAAVCLGLPGNYTQAASSSYPLQPWQWIQFLVSLAFSSHMSCRSPEQKCCFWKHTIMIQSTLWLLKRMKRIKKMSAQTKKWERSKLVRITAAEWLVTWCGWIGSRPWWRRQGTAGEADTMAAGSVGGSSLAIASGSRSSSSKL